MDSHFRGNDRSYIQYFIAFTFTEKKITTFFFNFKKIFGFKDLFR